MIKYIVAALHPRAERINIPIPGVGVSLRNPAEGVVAGERMSDTVRQGFSELESAVTYANGAAVQKPGTTFIIYQAVRAVEVPSGPLQEKRFNAAGELINV